MFWEKARKSPLYVRAQSWGAEPSPFLVLAVPASVCSNQSALPRNCKEDTENENTDVFLRSVFFSFFNLGAGVSKPACPRWVAKAMLPNLRSQIPRCRGPEERRPRQAAALWELCFGAGMLGARVFSAFLPLRNALVRWGRVCLLLVLADGELGSAQILRWARGACAWLWGGRGVLNATVGPWGLGNVSLRLLCCSCTHQYSYSALQMHLHGAEGALIIKSGFLKLPKQSCW